MYRFFPFLLAGLLVACGGSSDSVVELDSARATPPDSNTDSTRVVTSTSRKVPYEIASGVYEMTVSTLPGMTRTIYFTDSGAAEAVYTQVPLSSGTTSRTVDITKDGWRISYDESSRVGTKMLNPEVVIAGHLPNPRKMSEEMKQQYGYREMGTKEILGRQATGFSMTVDGMTMTEWEWKGIPLRIESDMGTGKPVVAEVTTLETDTPVPAAKFQVPADVTLTEQHIPGQPMSIRKR